MDSVGNEPSWKLIQWVTVMKVFGWDHNWLRIETEAFWRETNVSEQFPIKIRFDLQIWNRQKCTTLHGYDVKRRSPWCIILIVPESKSRLSLVTTRKMMNDLITSFVLQLAVWNTRQTLTSSFLKNVLARTNSWFARNWIKKHTRTHEQTTGSDKKTV